ncbi:MAG TPA: hypothetical protein VM537_12565 [Anaerolineae bacterium]|nr:hypothetical protein [Anaerolineae bacterium]
MKCSDPKQCPYRHDERFNKACILVGMLLVLMSAVAISAITTGKDGVITGAVCAGMGTAVSAILVGGIHRPRGDKKALPGHEGGE